jgi:hypothetical protein
MGTLHRLDRGRQPREWEGPAPIWQSAGAPRTNTYKDSASGAAQSQLATLQARFAAASLALDPLSGNALLVQFCGMHRVLRSTAEAWKFLRMFERRQGSKR